MATTKISAQLTEFNPGDPDYVLNATNAVTVGSGPQYNFNGVYGCLLYTSPSPRDS